MMMSPALTFPQEHRRGTNDEQQHHKEIVLDDHIGLLYITISQLKNSRLHSQEDVTQRTLPRVSGHMARQPGRLAGAAPVA